MDNLKTPARKPLAKREAGVAKRLKEARERLRLSQAEFAAQVGITRQRLASYEELRAPLRFDLALRICRQFALSEKWLATGKGHMRICQDLASESASHIIPLDMPFGRAYDQHLENIYETLLAQEKGMPRLILHDGDSVSLILNWVLFFIQTWVDIAENEKLPRDFTRGLATSLIQHGNAYMEFASKHKRLPKPDDYSFLKEPN